MNCICGHSDTFHEGDRQYGFDDSGNLGKCEECDECLKFRRDPNWEPPDASGWEGGIADNH